MPTLCREERPDASRCRRRVDSDRSVSRGVARHDHPVSIALAIPERRVFRPRVGAEFVGLARVFRQAVMAEECRVTAMLPCVINPVTQRLARKPRLRREQEIDFLRGWRGVPSRFRLSFDDTRDADDCLVATEVRLGSLQLRFRDWMDWESGVSITRVRVTTNRAMVFHAAPYVILSLHALARWFERTGRRTHEELLADIAPLATANEEDDSVHTRVGVWIGEFRMLATGNDTQFDVRAVRTYVGNY
jgi:hypothetical protein